MHGKHIDQLSLPQAITVLNGLKHEDIEQGKTQPQSHTK